jgi:hypothetical protein
MKHFLKRNYLYIQYVALDQETHETDIALVLSLTQQLQTRGPHYEGFTNYNSQRHEIGH